MRAKIWLVHWSGRVSSLGPVSYTHLDVYKRQGVITALNEAGLSVPADVSVVGFDDHEIAARCVPALTTVRQPLREEGHMAANIALNMIKGAEPTTSVMHMQLIQRDSL